MPFAAQIASPGAGETENSVGAGPFIRGEANAAVAIAGPGAGIGDAEEEPRQGTSGFVVIS